jgi:hypothetical protein
VLPRSKAAVVVGSRRKNGRLGGEGEGTGEAIIGWPDKGTGKTKLGEDGCTDRADSGCPGGTGGDEPEGRNDGE